MCSLSEIHYSRTALNQVICRFDFLQTLPNDLANQAMIISNVKRFFPHRTPEQVLSLLSINVEKSIEAPAKFDENNTEVIQHTYVSLNGMNKCIFTPLYIVFEMNAYNSFDEFKECVYSIMDAFSNVYSKLRIKRFGLRYINLFGEESIKPIQAYFVDYISRLLKTDSPNSIALSRAMTTFEYFTDDIRINSRVGLYNPNYPGVMTKKEDFAIDIDAFVDGAYTFDSIFPQKFITAHDAIHQLFESYIQDKLREKMNG